MTSIIPVSNPAFNRFFMKNNSSKCNENLAIKTLGLSLREAEVLDHVTVGKTNRDVSEILGISERTVEKHLERVYAKLGVGSRTAAAAMILNGKR